MSEGFDSNLSPESGAPPPEMCRICAAPMLLTGRRMVSTGPNSANIEVCFFRCEACGVQHPIIRSDDPIR